MTYRKTLIIQGESDSDGIAENATDPEVIDLVRLITTAFLLYITLMRDVS